MNYDITTFKDKFNIDHMKQNIVSSLKSKNIDTDVTETTKKTESYLQQQKLFKQYLQGQKGFENHFP